MARETWQTRVGFILAAVGSAVGLGNIWRFPWMAAENGGSAFLLMYLLIVFAIGVPGLIGELAIGRRGRLNPVGTFKQLGSDNWSVLGGFAILTAVVLLSFYSVVGGWVLRYVLGSATGAYFGAPEAYFGAVSTGVSSVGFHVVFLGLTAGIVYFGVADGIERATKLMIPTIVAMLVGLAAWGLTLDGATAGLEFYLSFDVAPIQENFLSLLQSALGQALFSLSVGTGAMLTYASYLDEDRSLLADGASIAVLNTIIGVMAGFVVFPILSSFNLLGASSGGGPGVIFLVLAQAFASLPFGRVLGVVFFGVLALAALSSAISILEIPVAYLVDEREFSRDRAVVLSAALYLLTGSAVALNGRLFTITSGPLVNLMLAVGLLGFLLFAGWVLGTDALAEFKAGAGDLSDVIAMPWLVTIGVLLPLFLAFTVLGGIVGLVNAVVPPAKLSVPTLGLVAGAIVVSLLAFVTLRRPKSVL
jgi:NSS family neurotransmitter:Na+ symporter